MPHYSPPLFTVYLLTYNPAREYNDVEAIPKTVAVGSETILTEHIPPRWRKGSCVGKSRGRNQSIMTVLEFCAVVTLLFAAFGAGYRIGRNTK